MNNSKETMDDFSIELEASFRKFKEGDVVTGTVIAVTDTEIILDLGTYTEGIISAENYSDDPSLSIKADVHPGNEIQATVISTDDGEGHLLLSRKEAAQLFAWDTLQQYQENATVLTVKISEIVKGGGVCYLEGIRGFIPASRLALSYVENLEEWLHRELKVQVLTVDKANNKLILSAKELLMEERAIEQGQLISNLEAGLVTEGTVESLKPYGAFVRLSNGISGLVHISQISQKRISHPASILKEGQSVTVKIIGIKDGKVSLSMKALEDVAAEEIHEETIELPETENIGTSLGSLFKNIQL